MLEVRSNKSGYMEILILSDGSTLAESSFFFNLPMGSIVNTFEFLARHC